jgi:hypothetical protein
MKPGRNGWEKMTEGEELSAYIDSDYAGDNDTEEDAV